MTQKQCTESKTRLGALVHTQRTLAARTVRPGCAHCAQAARALRRVVASSVRCRRHRRPCRRPGRPCRKLYRDTPSTKTMRVLQPVAGRVAALYRNTTSCQASTCHDTTDCIVTCPLARLPACHDTKTAS